MGRSVTYLLGAGASAQSLPTIDQLPTRLGAIAGAVSSHWRMSDKEITGEGSDQHFTITQNITEDLNWLANASSSHASVDTFAKKLFLTRNRDLVRLKNALAIFFVLEEALNKIDIRYDTFLASILKSDQYKFPDNVRILSWNYDSQLERAYSHLVDNREIHNARSRLGHIFNRRSMTSTNGKFNLIKLNGYGALHSEHEEYEFCGEFFSEKEKDRLADVYEAYKNLRNPMNRYKSSISFAWESSVNDNESIIHKAWSATSHTEVLVVIGYSFPFFNRDVDREIFNRMTNLQKVYFQSPEAELLLERFRSVRDAQVSQMIPIGIDQKQFFLPPEL